MGTASSPTIVFGGRQKPCTPMYTWWAGREKEEEEGEEKDDETRKKREDTKGKKRRGGEGRKERKILC